MTVQLFNVVSGGVPSARDVKAAIDDMEALYAACRWSGWMSNDPGMAHMKQVNSEPETAVLIFKKSDFFRFLV